MRLPLNFSLRIVFGVSLVVCLLALYFDKELGVNLLTELGGVALTVFVINTIIERRERQKRISIDQRILRELQYIIASYYSIWKHLCWQYLPKEKIESEPDLIKAYPRLISLANIKDQFTTISIQHPESWELFFYHRTISECFENYHMVITKEIKTFINDFKIYIEPELLDLLLSILESQYFKEIRLMHEETTPGIITDVLGLDPDKLDSYLKSSSTIHLAQIEKLIDYSFRLRNVIQQFKNDDTELYQLKKYFIHPSEEILSGKKLEL